jgi:hypothetical protein
MNLPIRHDTNLHAIAGLVDDRPAEHIFQINRRAFVDPEVYEAEMKHIFEATWVFVGLESQIPDPHDFVTTHIGRHPVLPSRDKDNKICCLLNTCRHRGTLVARSNAEIRNCMSAAIMPGHMIAAAAMLRFRNARPANIPLRSTMPITT